VVSDPVVLAWVAFPFLAGAVTAASGGRDVTAPVETCAAPSAASVADESRTWSAPATFAGVFDLAAAFAVGAAVALASGLLNAAPAFLRELWLRGVDLGGIRP